MSRAATNVRSCSWPMGRTGNASFVSCFLSCFQLPFVIHQHRVRARCGVPAPSRIGVESRDPSGEMVCRTRSNTESEAEAFLLACSLSAFVGSSGKQGPPGFPRATACRTSHNTPYPLPVLPRWLSSHVLSCDDSKMTHTFVLCQLPGP